jgi:hypothetical protein
MFHDSATVSCLLVSLILLIYFQNSKALLINRVQWLISGEG